MKKKIEKIRIINAPKENILNDEDLFNFMGRDNCASYDNSSCFWNKKTTCSQFNESACDNVLNGVKCLAYTTDPTT